MGRNPPQGKGQIYREYSVTKTRIFASPSRKQANLQPHYRVSVAAIRQGSNIPKRDWELLVIERSSQEIRAYYEATLRRFPSLMQQVHYRVAHQNRWCITDDHTESLSVGNLTIRLRLRLQPRLGSVEWTPDGRWHGKTTRFGPEWNSAQSPCIAPFLLEISMSRAIPDECK